MESIPDFKTFSKLARKGNLIPVYAEVLADLETPVSCFLKIDSGKYGFLLESVEGGRSQARYSFLGTEPGIILEVANGRVTLTRDGRSAVKRLAGDPLGELKNLLREFRWVSVPELPRFCGGAVGFMSYDCSRFYEKIPIERHRPTPFPDLFFMIADTLLVFDHVKRKILIVSNAHVPAGSGKAGLRRAYDTAVAKIEALRARLSEPTPPCGAIPPARRAGPLKPRSNFTRAAFEKAVGRIKHRIKIGDVIQTVISQRFETDLEAAPFDVYRALRSINPSPYMFFLKCGPFQLVGSSPEVHVRCEDGKVTLRPIAGTRPRGKDEAEDERLARGLLADPKERAEHVMLVDLGRNDLGRVCKTGSVKVKDFMLIEKYSHVMHIVSQVNGDLLKGKDLYDVIRATFPAGTVSGAPKVKAMEIINSLEPERRGPYAGLVGYLSFSGNFDSCITIRTLVARDGKAWVQAGAGIVADSKPQKEWMETRNKAAGVLQAVEMANKGLR